jgi:hypothetical protein
MIQNRTMSCVFDILSDIPVAQTLSLLTQIGISTYSLDPFVEPTAQFKTTLREVLLRLGESFRIELCSSVVELEKTIHSLTDPSYKFDERWRRFERSVALDGYLIQDGRLIAVDPITEHLVTPEDSLSELIHQCSIPEADDIVLLIEKSGDDYLKQPPDLNGCLSNMRTALETVAKSLASKTQVTRKETKDTSKWGNAISYLCSTGFLSKKEENVLTAVYSLLSEHHRPIRMDENEMVRFGRSMALALCWFLSKKATYEHL